MVEEFNLPTEIIDRKVTKMKMISPSNREVDVGKTLSEREYIGMCRREVFDDFLRKRAIGNGASCINGLFMGFKQQGADGPFTLKYNDYAEGGKVCLPPCYSGTLVLSWVFLQVASIPAVTVLSGIASLSLPHGPVNAVVRRVCSLLRLPQNSDIPPLPLVPHPMPRCALLQVGVPKELEVDMIIGADGANSRVAKEIGAGDYDYAIAFQERIKIADKDMEYYKDLAEMYVGDDVSPDFYGWVFPKYDHVAVGTGTVVNKTAIKQYQQATRDRSEPKTRGGKIIRVEAHPIPEHPRPKRVEGRVALVGDAAGYVTKCSGEGIYFAAKSGRMCAEAIVAQSKNGTVMVCPHEDSANLAEGSRMHLCFVS
jgi:flavin-dependent dehydrogenase